jgi:hypothetical protein
MSTLTVRVIVQSFNSMTGKASLSSSTTNAASKGRGLGSLNEGNMSPKNFRQTPGTFLSEYGQIRVFEAMDNSTKSIAAPSSQAQNRFDFIECCAHSKTHTGWVERSRSRNGQHSNSNFSAPPVPNGQAATPVSTSFASIEPIRRESKSSRHFFSSSRRRWKRPLIAAAIPSEANATTRPKTRSQVLETR